MRRLAAILAADVVGYARLMGADEEGVLHRLAALRAEVIKPKVEAHNGRIVKLMGDGLLAEFGSVVDAVACAVEWQDAVIAHQADVAPDGRIAYRIGVNLGDVIVEDGDLYGDGVNLAARLESVAPAGGVCLSEDAWRQVRGKLDLAWTEMGPQTLKNIAEPVPTFCLTRAGAAGHAHPPSARSPQLQDDKPSVAVLPFDNMSGDPEQEYFSDGITEDLITELSRFRELTVVSRNSSFAFKGQSLPISEIAGRLGVGYLVEGSIRRAGNRVRVTAQLIDGRGDRHIWAERYDRDLEDIFEVQDDVVHRVASTLAGRLEHERQERVRRKSSNELVAYDLYLQAREHFFIWSSAANRRAIELASAAVETEPGYAAALALLAEARLRNWLNGWSTDPAGDFAEARRLAAGAVAADDGDTRTHTAQAMVCLFNGEPDTARHHFETALRLNPNDTRVLVYYSRHAVLVGDPGHAVALADRALELNPFGKYHWNLAIAHFVARRYDDAVARIRNLPDPNAMVLAILAASLAMTGRAAEAAEAAARFAVKREATPALAAASDGVGLRRFFEERWPFTDPAETAHLTAALGRAGLPV